MTPDPRTPPELAELAAAACDGTITPEQLAQLEQLILANADARSEYSQRCEFDADLRLYWRSSGALDAALASVEQSAFEEPTLTPKETHATKPRPKSLLNWASRHPKGPSIAISVAVLLMIVGAMAVTPVGKWLTSSSKKDVEERQPEGPTASEFVAILNSSHEAKWLDNTQPRLRDPRLKIGRRLAIASGLLEVKYYSGVTVVIEGPAEFWVGSPASETVGNAVPGVPQRHKQPQPAELARKEGEGGSVRGANSGFLKLGSLVARVEGKEAQGFTIDTPSGRVEDFGTEFGVEVDGNGAAEFIVLSGKVDVIRERSPGVVAERVRLTKDQGAYVASNSSTIARRANADPRLLASMRSRLKIIDEMPTASEKLVHASTRLISSNSDFNISVYPGKASYSGLASDVFGDGTVEAYYFVKNEFPGTGGKKGPTPEVLVRYADDGSETLSDPTHNRGTGFADFWRGDVWTTNDPGVAFSNGEPANFGGDTETISGGYEVSGTVDVTNFASGTVYLLVGGYSNPFQVTVAMRGKSRREVLAGEHITPGNTRNMYVIAFDFDNADRDYDTITYNYSGSASNRSRFMGVVVDGVAVETDAQVEADTEGERDDQD